MKQVETHEQRTEARLRYSWPVWYAESLSDMLSQGQMVDVSSKGAAFTCYADRCPKSGDKVTTRFSVPTCNAADPFDLESFVREGSVCRVEELSPFVRKVAMQFAEPLPFNPAETSAEDILDEEFETI